MNKVRSGKIMKTKPLKNVWDVLVGGDNKKPQGHPAVFPEQLANDHIVTWSNENDLVFDPFMGSGTTAIMALKNNRQYLGCEVSKKYIDIINKRIDQHQDGNLLQYTA